jgi:hypothetical protein
MIIKNKIDNEPVLSNVGEVGEFRIRNSAKAFGILSSGLYANKIRAIVREYSCNAVDSHTEAGNLETPFDVHLPNALEPWFSIRDYGVGLDEQQVRNIFTTYFESTKTETDDLIGGLGLGSKSAFSFTDNFTIVAVKNGKKRVYTAFINDHGVPSIAPMGEEGSNEPSGVEIRFAVEDQYDFRKFQEEARHVYKHFKLRPVVSGGYGEFSFIDPEYEDRDIIPGVHTVVNTRGYNQRSVAIMGNIEYPLDVPSNMDLGDVGNLLNCGLVIEFGIGELDIQASREGLSYIPETVAAIKAKLEALNAILADKVAADIAAIKNPWEKAYALHTKLNTSLWSAAANKFITDTGFNLLNTNRYGDGKTFLFTEADLVKKFNIKITAFKVRGNYYSDRVASNVNQQNVYDNGHYTPHWAFQVTQTTQFVVNDTTVGVGNRAKYHWKTVKDMGSNDYVYVLSKADKSKDMRTKAFFNALSTPPANQIRKASTLIQQERAAGMGKGVTVLKLEKRDNNRHLRSDDMVWRDAGDMTAFVDTKTYYYLPMSGFQTLGAAKDYDMKAFAKALKESGVVTETVYGVRKADLEKIKGLSNWVNLDEYVSNKLAQQGALDVKGVVKEAIGFDAYFKIPYVQNDVTNAASPYLKLYNEFAGTSTVSKSVRQGFQTLCTIYHVTAGNVNVNDEIAKYKTEMDALSQRYPLINELTRYFRDHKAVAEYINAIDLLKGI